MTTIVDTIQAIVRQELSRVRVADLGVVEAVGPHSADDDKDNYGCDVRLKNTALLLKRVPIATGHIGSAAIPNVGDLVLLTYELGDVNQPIVIGRMYSDADRPPLNDTNEMIMRLPLAEDDDKTIKTAVRNIPSNSPPREMIMEMTPKITVQINDGKVYAAAGQQTMTLDQQGSTGGSVTVVAGSSTMTIDQDGDITVQSAGSITLTATGDLTLQGNSVSITSQLDTSITAGTELSCSATAGATIDGGVSATLQAATLMVQGITTFSP